MEPDDIPETESKASVLQVFKVARGGRRSQQQASKKPQEQLNPGQESKQNQQLLHEEVQAQPVQSKQQQSTASLADSTMAFIFKEKLSLSYIFTGEFKISWNL